MKFNAEITIDDEHLDVLLDYDKGYTLDSEYFIATGRELIESEMFELIEGGFYSHYPLSPTPLGYFILKLWKNKK